MKKKGLIVVAATVATASVLVSAGYMYWHIASGSPAAKPVTADHSKKALSESHSNTDKGGSNDEASVTGQADSSTYVNSRFGFKMNYPKGLAVRESANGDGATLSLPEHSDMSVRAYGFATTVMSMSEMAQQRVDVDRAERQDVVVTEEKNVLLDDHPAIDVTWTYTANAEDAPWQGTIKKRAIMTRKDDAAIVLETSGQSSAVSETQSTFSALIQGFSLR